MGTMKRARPWLYFLFFIVALATISALRAMSRDTYERYASVAIAIWVLSVIVLSVIALYRRGTSTDSRDGGGFGMAALPLPRSWKRWIYDESPDDKKNSN